MLLKSMKYEIIKPTDSTWEEFGRVLSELRYKSARIANYTVQLLWQWDNFRWEYKEQEGVFPDNSQKPNFYKILRNRFPEVGVDIIGQTSRWIENRYSSIRKDMFMLRKSVLSFKDNMPIFLNNQSYIRQGYIGIIQKMHASDCAGQQAQMVCHRILWV